MSAPLPDCDRLNTLIETLNAIKIITKSENLDEIKALVKECFATIKEMDLYCAYA